MREVWCLTPLCWLLAACAGHPDLGPTLARCAEVEPGCTVAIAYRDVRSGDAASVHGDLVLHAASTMKVPVMIELHRQSDCGRLDLDARVPLRNEFASIVDGSPYALAPEDDSDPELYARVGGDVELRELVRRMIVRSSNLATNTLIALARAERVQATCAELGTRHTAILRGVEDSKAFAAGRNNVTTADDLATLMLALARDRAASPAACAEMRRILLQQEDRDLIPAGLPPGTPVAHKTGQITRHRHDAAIVDPDGNHPYVLVVLTRGFDDPARAAQVIADVTRAVAAARRRL